MSWSPAVLRRHAAYPFLLGGLSAATLALLVFLSINLGHAYGYGSPGTKDFIEYWSAGRLLTSGQSPYDFDRLRALQAEQGVPPESRVLMWNPPWLLVWILPLIVVPFIAAALAWLVINGLLIFTSATLIWRTFAPASISSRLAIPWVACLFFVPALLTLQMGQISVLLFFGVAGFLFFSSRERDFCAGMCLALTTIKPHVVYLVWLVAMWWILKEKRWRTLAGVAVVMSLSLGVLTLLWPDWGAGYAAAIFDPPDWATPTLGTLMRLLLVSDIRFAQFLPSLLVGGVLVSYLVLRRPTVCWKTILAPLLLLSVATAAYGWSFDMIVLLVPYLKVITWISDGQGVTRAAGEFLPSPPHWGRGVGGETAEYADEPLHPQPLSPEYRGEGSSNAATRLRLRILVPAALLLIAVVMIVQNLTGQTGHLFIWVPWSLALVYGYARAHRGLRVP